MDANLRVQTPICYKKDNANKMFARLVARMMDANLTWPERGHGDEQSCQQRNGGLEARPFWAVVGHLTCIVTRKAVQLYMPPGDGLGRA